MKQDEKKKKKKSWGRRLLTALLALIILAGLVLLGGRLYFRLPVSGYYAASQRAFLIPGLSDRFVPQGLSLDPASDTFLITGYRKGGGASPVYAVRRGSGECVASAALYTPEGTPFTGHAGGLSVCGELVYVAGSGCVHVYSLQDLLSARDCAPVKSLGSVPAQAGSLTVGVAFTAVSEDLLWVGEFYREPQYPTPESHKFTTPAGDRQQALAVCYRLDPARPLGIDPAPVALYTLPDLAQGMAVTADRICVSTSWGTGFSHILGYDRQKLTPFAEAEGVPLYALDSAALASDWKLPPMAEEIEIVDGTLYTMCESASSAYWFGLLNGAQWCYATPVDKLEK